MSDSDVFSALPAPLAKALTRQGFTTLTSVQSAVLRPDLAGRDLRIGSRTGSGKTVALGLAVYQAVVDHKQAPTASLCARPAVLLVAPTRELAAQVGKELAWLFADVGSVCVVTGGTSTSNERRSLARGPAVVVGTPGRLCDHLDRGALELSKTRAIVLDEADQMFDLGFREALETLLGGLPEGCNKHLVSATFPRQVLALAARHQKNAVLVEGDAIDAAHSDITHVAHLVHMRERYAALVNVLLVDPELRTLIFVRTRADASEVAARLSADGFRAGALSGELAQNERTRMLDAFRKGALAILVCTDVASRGIDVPEVARVIHAELPDNAEVLTHRSGRTGRAGRKGTSIMLVPTAQYRYAESLLRGAGVEAELVPAPNQADVLRLRDERLFEELTASNAPAAEDAVEGEEPKAVAPAVEIQPLTARLIEALGAEAAVEMLLQRVKEQGACAPMPISDMNVDKPMVRRPTTTYRPDARPERSGAPNRTTPRPQKAQRR